MPKIREGAAAEKVDFDTSGNDFVNTVKLKPGLRIGRVFEEIKRNGKKHRMNLPQINADDADKCKMDQSLLGFRAIVSLFICV